MRVLILNSDSPKNRGDRAILAGNIELVRQVYPQAEIWSLSQYDERDAKWFGINFHKFSPYSVSPKDFLDLLAAAKKADLILWGGGEILKIFPMHRGLVAVQKPGARQHPRPGINRADGRKARGHA